MYQKISSITSWKHFSRLLWINLPSPRYPGFPNGWRYPKLAGWFHGKSENHMNLGKWAYFTHLNWAIKGDDFPISKPWFGVALLRKYPAFHGPIPQPVRCTTSKWPPQIRAWLLCCEWPPPKNGLLGEMVRNSVCRNCNAKQWYKFW